MTDTILIDYALEEDLNIGIGKVEVAAPSGGRIVGHRINLSSFGITKFSTEDFGTIAPSSHFAVNVTVPGAQIGYPVLVDSTTALGIYELTIFGRVLTENTVTVIIRNEQTLNPATVGSIGLNIIVFPIPSLSQE